MRRRLAILLVAAFILTGVALPTPVTRPTVAQDSSGDWPMFRGNAARTGSGAGIGAQDAKLRWEFETAGEIYSSPAIADNVIYFGSQDRNFYAVDVLTGLELWKIAIGDTGPSSPTVANGVVYVGGDGSFLHAIYAETGTQRWKFKTGDAIYSSPVVMDGVVYVGSYDNFIYALDATTGYKLWQFNAGGDVLSSPTVVGRVLYFGGADSHVYAVDTDTGKLIWRFKTGGPVVSTAAVAGGVVFIGSRDNYLYALEAKSGDERWRFKTGGLEWSSPAIADGSVFVGSDDEYVYALDSSTGATRWRAETGGKIRSSPTVVDGVVYIGSDDRKFYAFDATNGAELWTFKTGMPIFASAAVVAGIIYLGSRDGKVYALGLTSEERASAEATATSMGIATATQSAIMDPWRNYFWNVGYNLEWLSNNHPDWPVGLEMTAEDIVNVTPSPNEDGSWSYLFFAPISEIEKMAVSVIGLTVFPSDDAARRARDELVEKQVRSGFKTVSTDRIDGDATCMTYVDQEGVEGVCHVVREEVLIIGLSSLPTDAPDAVLMNAADLAQMGLLATRDLVLPE